MGKHWIIIQNSAGVVCISESSCGKLNIIEAGEVMPKVSGLLNLKRHLSG